VTTSPVEIVTLRSLLDRPGFVDFQNTLPTGRVFACLGTAERPRGLVPIEIDSGQFTQLGPLVERAPLSIAERQSLWQAAIHWATSQRAGALQIVCSLEDLGPLAQLGWECTTEILQLVRRPGAAESEPSDPAIIASSELRGPEAVELVVRTLIDSLDLPEALTIRTPLALLQSWHESIPLMNRLILTARSPEGPVGILVAGPGTEGVEIRYLGIDNRYRQQGWGRRLLHAAVQRNAGVPITAFVDARNRPAVQLYERIGFVEEHRSPLCFRILQP
jgi:ribosomal protein S18 acetylase RimI-like enzyme